MLIDRQTFFKEIRKNLFSHGLSQEQVDGFNALLHEWEKRYPGGDLRWLAYELATTQWETAHTIQPIEEYGKGSGKKYGVPDPQTGETYYGRGYVQLTWKDNYAKMCKPTGADLVADPAIALRPDVAATILFHGMEQGSFTGKSCADYFTETKTDWINARQIINGNDHDREIAQIAKKYYTAIKKSVTAYVANQKAVTTGPLNLEDRVALLERKLADITDFFANL